MAKKTAKMPMVSSVSARIKSIVSEGTTTQVTTPEETVARKQNFLGMLDKATETIMKNLEDGKMELTSSMDLERIVKLSLLVSGEADSITGKAGKETTEEMGMESEKISMSKIEQILDVNDPEVQAMYDKLYNSYNELNDEEGED